MPPQNETVPDYDVRVATVSDIPDIVALQEANLVRNGGVLSAEFPPAWFRWSCARCR